MKKLNRLANSLGLVVLTVGISACQGTSNTSDPAPAASVTSYCPSNGYYIGASGQSVSCTPGQPYTQGYSGCSVSGTYTNPTTGQISSCSTTQTTFTPPTGYPYQTNSNPSCDGYYAIYGVQYVPIYLNGQLVCANYNILTSQLQQDSSYASTAYAQYGPEYYNQYPPYSDSGSGGCGVTIGVSYDNFSGSVCF